MKSIVLRLTFFIIIFRVIFFYFHEEIFMIIWKIKFMKLISLKNSVEIEIALTNHL